MCKNQATQTNHEILHPHLGNPILKTQKSNLLLWKRIHERAGKWNGIKMESQVWGLLSRDKMNHDAPRQHPDRMMLPGEAESLEAGIVSSLSIEVVLELSNSRSKDLTPFLAPETSPTGNSDLQPIPASVYSHSAFSTATLCNWY